MTRFVCPRPAEAFVLSEANGFQSRADGVLKQSATIYAVGTLVISEIVADAKTGKYVRATQALVDADEDGVADYGLVLREKDATAGDVGAALFVRNGEVKGKEFELDVTITVAEAAAILAKQGVIVR